MENQGIQKIQDQHQGLERLTEKEEQIAGEIVTFNSLRSYPLSDNDIIDWSRIIIRLMPEKTPEDIREAVDRLILGKIYYDKNAGIQNLVYALKVIDGSDFTDRL